MTIDPYSPCPGGTGKKLKFCCADLLSELEKIQRMLDGEQRQACLDQIAKLEGQFADRACLLSIKALVQMQLGHEQDARETLDRFLAKHPQNPVALAEQALLTVSDEGSVAAVRTLQRAIQFSPDPTPDTVINVMHAIAAALVEEGKFQAARALARRTTAMRPDDEQAAQLVSQLNGSQHVPLLLKEEFDLEPSPQGASFAGEFDRALGEADRGRWLSAVEQFDSLAEKSPDSPEIWWNVAILQLWLGDDARAVDALRKFATSNVPLDEAAEAEALANWFDEEPSAGWVDELFIEYPVADVEALLAKLSAHPQAVQVQIAPRQLDSEEPPPKSAFIILDRQPSETGVDITIEKMPRVLGRAFVFGKQTDREARLELLTCRDQRFDEAKTTFERLTGDSLGPAGSDEVVGKRDAVEHAMRTEWYIPPDTPHDHLQKLIREHARQVVLDEWPKLPERRLDGKTPQEASGDESYRIRLLALVLNLQLAMDRAKSDDIDFNELRANLNLPIAEPVPANEYESLDEIPLMELERVKLEELSDDELGIFNMRAVAYGARTAMIRCAQEMLNRPKYATDEFRPQLYSLLYALAPNSRKALEYLKEGRKAAEGAGQSTAGWDLQELELRHLRNEPDDFMRVLQHLQTDHLNEPGVREAMTRFLISVGAIGPDGRPAAPQQPAEQIGEVAAQPAAPAAGKLWTPDSEQAVSGKSALWTPGDD